MSHDREHFIERYATGNKPWDHGTASAELIRVIEAGGFPAPPRSVLEFGCGSGTNAIELARRGYRVTALDFVPAIIQVAREKAEKAGVAVTFLNEDVVQIDLGTFDLLFDRGVYHGLRRENLSGFLETLKKVSRPGTRWLSLAGNAREQTEQGPPRVSEKEFRAELGPLFEILEVHEFRFGPEESRSRPLAWSILMERKSD